MEYQHMSALDASQDREGHEIDSGGRSESDDELDRDSVAIGNLAPAAPYDITARGYGPSGPGLAKYLARKAIVWHELRKAGRAGSGTECLASRSATRGDRRREHRHRPAPCPPRRAMADV